MGPSNPYGSAGSQQLGESSLVRTATPRTENSWGFDAVLAQCTRRYLSAPPLSDQIISPTPTVFSNHTHHDMNLGLDADGSRDSRRGQTLSEFTSPTDR